MHPLLPNIRIVMINTSHPGNIGAAARAMKNMGLSDLALVDPKSFPDGEATARASGADDILQNARVVSTLEEAICDARLVIGASARLRSIPWPQLDATETADLVAVRAEKTAIVFGREHSGLTNDELERCHYLLHIPTDPNFSSLNVAAAIQVVTYELFKRLSNAEKILPKASEEGATAAQMESYFGHLETVLREIHFLHASKHEMSIMRRLRRIYNRAQLEEEEVHLLRGILTRIQRRTPQS